LILSLCSLCKKPAEENHLCIERVMLEAKSQSREELLVWIRYILSETEKGVSALRDEIEGLENALDIKQKECNFWRQAARSFHELIEARKDLHYHAFEKERS
jgi:hypothetical protein